MSVLAQDARAMIDAESSSAATHKSPRILPVDLWKKTLNDILIYLSSSEYAIDLCSITDKATREQILAMASAASATYAYERHLQDNQAPPYLSQQEYDLCKLDILDIVTAAMAQQPQLKVQAKAKAQAEKEASTKAKSEEVVLAKYLSEQQARVAVQDKAERELTLPFEILIQDFNFENILITCTLADKVGAIKARVFAKGGLPAAQQRLIYNGSILEDDRTLFDYSYHHKRKTIHLVQRFAPQPDVVVNPSQATSSPANLTVDTGNQTPQPSGPSQPEINNATHIPALLDTHLQQECHRFRIAGDSIFGIGNHKKLRRLEDAMARATPQDPVSEEAVKMINILHYKADGKESIYEVLKLHRIGFFGKTTSHKAIDNFVSANLSKKI